MYYRADKCGSEFGVRIADQIKYFSIPVYVGDKTETNVYLAALHPRPPSRMDLNEPGTHAIYAEGASTCAENGRSLLGPCTVYMNMNMRHWTSKERIWTSSMINGCRSLRFI